ncbi:MAG: hypothetical protein P3X22_001200 [Thermoprotei archaeon]|nr:hypothetical protein [Thermoprotei archaeon]
MARRLSVLCARCRVPMDYILEVERAGSERVVSGFYRCPACGYRILDEKATVKRFDDMVVLEFSRPNSGRKGLIVELLEQV